MTHYDQAMKHWGNHRKDRFMQPCGGPLISSEVPTCKHDYEIEIKNKYGGTDFFLQTALSPENAVDLFFRYYKEDCTICRVWDADNETRESAKLIHVRREDITNPRATNL